MLNTIVVFFSNLYNNAIDELAKFRECMIWVLISTTVGVAAIMIVNPTVEKSVWITLIPWLFSGYLLYSIRRFIRVHVTGEMLELLQVSAANLSKAAAKLDTLITSEDGKTTIKVATPLVGASVPKATAEPASTATGILDNPFIRAYLNLISGIFIAQTALFLILPLYVNYTVGSKTALIMIVMLLAIIALDNFTSFKRVTRGAVKISILAYALGLVFVLFPHVSFYLGEITDKVGVNIVSMSTAKRVNELAAIQKKQQENIDNEFVDGIIAWQKANPGAKLPLEYEEALKKARRLGMMKSAS